MTNYYLLENGKVTQSAEFKFDDNCLETDEKIVREELSGQLYLQSDYNNLIATEEYKTKLALREKESKIIELTSQIEKLDQKRIRAGFESTVKDESTGQTWLEYYTSKIQDLRFQINALN